MMVVEIVFKASTLQLQVSRARTFATTALQEKFPKKKETTQKQIAFHAHKARTWTKLGSNSVRTAHHQRLPKKVQLFVQSATLVCSCRVLIRPLRPLLRYVVAAQTVTSARMD